MKGPEFDAWRSMIHRCTNPRAHAWKDYGGRGIRVCERWLDFACFLSDVGPRPSSIHSIDRIDNDGHYEPGNVRWATPSEQSRNTRRAANAQAVRCAKLLLAQGVRRDIVISSLGLKRWTVDRLIEEGRK